MLGTHQEDLDALGLASENGHAEMIDLLAELRKDDSEDRVYDVNRLQMQEVRRS